MADAGAVHAHGPVDGPAVDQHGRAGDDAKRVGQRPDGRGAVDPADDLARAMGSGDRQWWELLVARFDIVAHTSPGRAGGIRSESAGRNE